MKTFRKIYIHSQMWCDITVGSNIVSTALSFSFNLSEKLALNCALFVNKSTVKWSEQRTKFLLMRSGSSLKIKFIHSFLTLRSEGRQCKDCFSTSWHCIEFCCLQSHLYRLVCLSPFTYMRGSWVGLNIQWCRSRRWSSVEAVLIHTITS